MTTTRTERVEVKLTPDEKQKLRKKSKKTGLGMAGFVRMKIFTGESDE